MKKSTKRTPAQNAALQRGSDIRQLRGVIANLSNFHRKYPQVTGVYEMIDDLTHIHDELFGPMKCWKCGEPSPLLQSMCDTCREEV